MAERFIMQTLLRKWAYAMPYRDSGARDADLPRWLRRYDHTWRHPNLARRAPIARLGAQPTHPQRL